MWPTDKEKQKQARYTIAYFAPPDDDASVHCLDVSTKYTPIPYKESIEIHKEVVKF